MSNQSMGAIQGGAGGVMGGGLVGGVLGGLAGWYGGKEADNHKKKLEEFYNSIGNGQTGPAYQSAYSDFRGNQQNLISNLEAMAAGRGPSLASAQLREATDRNIAQQQALSQSGQGNPAFAALVAANNAGRLGAAASRDSANTRVQEQLGAINALGLNIHGARGADEDNNRFNTSAQNNNMMSNADRQLSARRLQLEALTGQKPTGPSLGEQILAGGSGMLGQYISMAGAAGGKPPVR